MTRLREVMTALGGIASRRELLARGFTGGDLARALREGELRRLRRGHYATPGAPRDGCVAVRIGGRVGCLSALRSHGIWGGFDDEATHVSLPLNAARLRWMHDEDGTVHSDRSLDRAVVLHWCGVPVGHRGEHASSWRLGLREALGEVAHCAGRADVRAAFESAIAEGKLTLGAAQRLLDATMHVDAPKLVLSPDSGSGAESHLIEVLRGLGLAFVQQVELEGVGRVDFVIEGLLIVEVDGYAFHRSPEQFDEDRRRDAAALALGYPPLRLPARLVVEQPHVAASRILDALEAVRALTGVRSRGRRAAA